MVIVRVSVFPESGKVLGAKLTQTAMKFGIRSWVISRGGRSASSILCLADVYLWTNQVIEHVLAGGLFSSRLGVRVFLLLSFFFIIVVPGIWVKATLSYS